MRQGAIPSGLSERPASALTHKVSLVGTSLMSVTVVEPTGS